MDTATLYERYRDFDLVVDSRRVRDPARTLFFALRGARTDGHAFVGELISIGVQHFVVTEEWAQAGQLARPPILRGASRWAAQVQTDDEEQSEVAYHTAPDPLTVLQDLAAHHRRRFRIPVVAITGSNGKTIVKDWLAQLLGATRNVCASPRSYNSQIGVPLSVWRLRAEHDVAVFEAGVSRSGEMARLARILRPTHGVFTVLGSAHDAGFSSRAEKHAEKLRLFDGCEWVAVSTEDTATVGLLRRRGTEVFPFLGVAGKTLEVEDRPLRLPFPELPPVYLENAYTAAAAAYGLGLDAATLRREVPKLRPLTNRLEQREGRRGGVVINDSYSNDASALAAALEFAVAQNPFPDLTLVLGTLQAGTHPSAGIPASAPNVPYAPDERVTRLITVGAANAALGAAHHYATPEDLLADLDQLDFGQQTTLVKGASYERLDRVADALSRQQHRTVLRRDLTALRHNFRTYRERAGTGMIVMVKASAYGSGSLPVARALVAAGADRLAVAYPDEGRALREGGLRLPILVLNAEPAHYARCAADDLEPVVHRTADLERALRAGLRVHLELDTGMGRLGFGAGEREQLLIFLRSLGEKSAFIASIFTHLAAADEPAHDAFTRAQLQRFDDFYAAIADTLGHRPARHVLNSNGITRFADHAYEFVRLGIGLYGIGDAELGDKLRPALRLSTYVTRVYDHPAGTTIGYGRRGELDRDSRIAVLPIGYADGLPRRAGEGRFAVRFAGGLAPIVGSVCMDMTMVDVTGLAEVRAGSEAVIFGPSHPVGVLAAAAETIPYEVLTGVGERVYRVYLEE